MRIIKFPLKLLIQLVSYILYLLLLFLFIVFIVLRSISYRANISSTLYNSIQLSHIIRVKIFSMRTKKFNETPSHSPDDNSHIIVIIAGPIIRNKKFTLQTIKLLSDYKQIASIIYSTNSKLNKRELDFLDQMKVKTIINQEKEKLDGNLSNQSNNLISALKFVSDCLVVTPKTMILRMRSDQRFTSIDFLYTIKSYFDFFNNGRRIIALSHNSFINRELSISDMFQFGLYEDVYRYWNINEKDILDAANHLNEHKLQIFPEAIINCIYFFKKHLYYPENMSDYTILIREEFIIVNSSELGLIWTKEPPFDYINSHESRYYNLKNITHAIWLGLINNPNKED